MYLTVLERYLRAIETKLKTISLQNGYSYDVQNVLRISDVPMIVGNHEIRIMATQIRGDEKMLHGTANVLYVTTPMTLWYAAPALEHTDQTFSQFASDIQRAVGPYTAVVESTYAGVCSREVKIEFVNSQQIPARDAGQMFAMSNYNVRYQYVRGDPRLWDDVDELYEDQS